MNVPPKFPSGSSKIIFAFHYLLDLLFPFPPPLFWKYAHFLTSPLLAWENLTRVLFLIAGVNRFPPLMVCPGCLARGDAKSVFFLSRLVTTPKIFLIHSLWTLTLPNKPLPPRFSCELRLRLTSQSLLQIPSFPWTNLTDSLVVPSPDYTETFSLFCPFTSHVLLSIGNPSSISFYSWDSLSPYKLGAK